MNGAERLKEYPPSESFDRIILYIKTGKIKCGKYSDRVKIKKNKIIKDKELFTNGPGKSEDHPKKSK